MALISGEYVVLGSDSDKSDCTYHLDCSGESYQ